MDGLVDRVSVLGVFKNGVSKSPGLQSPRAGRESQCHRKMGMIRLCDGVKLDRGHNV